jgi:hypothetical protein
MTKLRWATLANRGKDRVEHGTLALLDEIRRSIPPA